MKGYSIRNRITIGVAFIFCVVGIAMAVQSTNTTTMMSQNPIKAPNYPNNENGQTYGSATEATPIETLPDLVFAGSVDGTAGYLLKKDFLKPGGRNVPLYNVDGNNIIGSIHISPKNSSYPKNENGQTFGSAADATFPETEPELISAYGVDGTEGYILKKDLDEKQPKTPEEALAIQKNRPVGGRDIPLYAVDGETVIGVFHIK